MPDGSVHEILKDKPSLKKGSVPSIFPAIPSTCESKKLLKEAYAIKCYSFEVIGVASSKFF